MINECILEPINSESSYFLLNPELKGLGGAFFSVREHNMKIYSKACKTQNSDRLKTAPVLFSGGSFQSHRQQPLPAGECCQVPTR